VAQVEVHIEEVVLSWWTWGGGGFKFEFKFGEWKSLRNLQPAGSKLHILRLTMNGR
jgi:hypothetical protein